MFQFDFNFNFITFSGVKKNIYFMCIFILGISTLNLTYCAFRLSDLNYILHNVPCDPYFINDTLQYKELFALMCEKNLSSGVFEKKNIETHFDFLENKNQIKEVDLLNSRMYASAYRVKSSLK